MKSIRKINDLIAGILSFSVVFLCWSFIATEQKLYIKDNQSLPYISLSSDANNLSCDVSAGFFIPTGNNFAYNVEVPKLSYDIFLVDISSINVFTQADRAIISGKIDTLKDVFLYNVLDSIILSDAKNFKTIGYTIGSNIEMHDILSGDKKTLPITYQCDDTSIVVYRNDGTFFCSPSENMKNFPEIFDMSEYKNFDTKILKIDRGYCGSL